jgi:sigma-B regulation protein RsbU (phosphoserine phosphatase)
MAGSDQLSTDAGAEDISTSFKGVYMAGAAAIAIGIIVDFLLNVITPLNLSILGFYGVVRSTLDNWGARLTILGGIVFISCVLIILVMALILKPVAVVLRRRSGQHDTRSKELEHASRRLLNFPYMFIAASIGIWVLLPAAIFFFAHMRNILAFQSAVIYFLRATFVGLIASFIGFHEIEHQMRRGLIPFFFPEGRLTEIPGTAKLAISRRIRMLYRLGSMVPVIILLVTLMMMQWELESGTITAKDYGRGIIAFVMVLFGIFFFTTGLLNRRVSRSITRPLNEIARVLKNVRYGRFDQKVRVVSNDEVGYVGDVINEMLHGLVERDRMRQSLELAKEVQQNLLPQNDLTFGDIQIAGRSIYCDETGGDYFDFIPLNGFGTEKIGIAIGDVSGHGIPSALLMATVRSSLRQRSAMPGDIGQILTDVNRQLVGDVEDSGQFMTLFYLMIDTRNKSLKWVRAGHDPAICYDPQIDTFYELGGRGVGLGVVEGFSYDKSERRDYKRGQILCLSTDGFWEARNPEGEMFGKERIYNIIRKNAPLNAGGIRNAVFNELSKFRQDAKIEDDITLVVVKL